MTGKIALAHLKEFPDYYTRLARMEDDWPMRHHMRTSRFVTRERGALFALLAIVGPGLLAGLSDDDPAGITTYSILGADFGYKLLWVLLVSTGADPLPRPGRADGHRHRQRAGRRHSRPLRPLAGLALGGLPDRRQPRYDGGRAGRYRRGSPDRRCPSDVSVPIAAVTVSVLVIAGSFHRVEHVLLALSAIFVTYIASGPALASTLGARSAKAS